MTPVSSGTVLSFLNRCAYRGDPTPTPPYPGFVEGMGTVSLVLRCSDGEELGLRSSPMPGPEFAGEILGFELLLQWDEICGVYGRGQGWSA